jgi:hypothetical protein
VSEQQCSGSGIRDEQPRSYFLELGNHYFGLKYLNSLMRIRDPGSGMGTIQIRDPGWKKVGSGINIPDPHYCGAGSFFKIFSFYNPKFKLDLDPNPDVCSS